MDIINEINNLNLSPNQKEDILLFYLADNYDLSSSTITNYDNVSLNVLYENKKHSISIPIELYECFIDNINKLPLSITQDIWYNFLDENRSDDSYYNIPSQLAGTILVGNGLYQEANDWHLYYNDIVNNIDTIYQEQIDNAFIDYLNEYDYKKKLKNIQQNFQKNIDKRIKYLEDQDNLDKNDKKKIEKLKEKKKTFEKRFERIKRRVQMKDDINDVIKDIRNTHQGLFAQLPFVRKYKLDNARSKGNNLINDYETMYIKNNINNNAKIYNRKKKENESIRDSKLRAVQDDIKQIKNLLNDFNTLNNTNLKINEFEPDSSRENDRRSQYSGIRQLEYRNFKHINSITPDEIKNAAKDIIEKQKDERIKSNLLSNNVLQKLKERKMKLEKNNKKTSDDERELQLIYNIFNKNNELRDDIERYDIAADDVDRLHHNKKYDKMKEYDTKLRKKIRNEIEAFKKRDEKRREEHKNAIRISH